MKKITVLMLMMVLMLVVNAKVMADDTQARLVYGAGDKNQTEWQVEDSELLIQVQELAANDKKKKVWSECRYEYLSTNQEFLNSIEEYLINNMKDPESYKRYGISVGKFQTCFYTVLEFPLIGKGFYVKIDYSGTNTFGGRMRSVATFFVSLKGKFTLTD